jgi:hypothetical protein
MRHAWLPWIIALLGLLACGKNKPATVKPKTPVDKPADPEPEKNHTLSAPMDAAAAAEAFRKATATLDAAVLAGGELDLGDFFLKLGMEAKGACAAGGRPVVLRPAGLDNAGLEPTAQGLIVGFVDTEHGECVRNIGFCALTIRREKSGRFHLRAADLPLQVGRANLTVSGEYALGRGAWVMVLLDEETETCKESANPGGEEAEELTGDYHEGGGAQNEAMQELVALLDGELVSLGNEPLYAFERQRHFELETKVDLAVYAVAAGVLEPSEVWILALRKDTARSVTAYEDEHGEPLEGLQDETRTDWTCERISAKGVRGRVTAQDVTALKAHPRTSHLRCGESKSDLEPDGGDGDDH